MIFRFLMFMLAVVVAMTVTLLSDIVADTLLLQTYLLIALIGAVMGFGVYLNRYDPIPILSDPFMLLCVFLAQFFIFGPIAARYSGIEHQVFFYGFAPERPVQVLAAFVVMLLLIILGNQVRLGRTLASLLPDFHTPGRKLPGQWAEILILGLSLAGCMVWLFIYQGGLWAKMSTGYGGWRAGGAMFRIAFVGFQMGTLLMAWRIISTKTRNFRYLALFYAVIAYNILFFGIIYGARKYLLFLFFGIFTIWMLRRGFKALPKTRVAVIVVLLMVFFSVWGAVRNRPLAEIISGQEDARRQTRGLHEGYLAGVSGPFSGACLIWELVPSVEPYRYGQTALVSIFGFIPRAVWPDKPVSFGKEITKYVVGPFYEPVYGYSVGFTIMGDFYLNFGWFGIIIGGFLIGLVCRVVSAYATDGMVDGKQHVAARVVLPAVFLMGLGEVRGDMAVFIATYGLSFAPILVLMTLFDFHYPVESNPQPYRRKQVT